MNNNIIVNTSVDDLRSSLHFYDPITSKIAGKIEVNIIILKDNVAYEMKNRNRRSVINLLNSKIKQFEKQLP